MANIGPLDWLLIPSLITVALFLWALFLPIDDGGGRLSGVGRVLTLIIALVISLVTWITTAIFYALMVQSF